MRYTIGRIHSSRRRSALPVAICAAVALSAAACGGSTTNNKSDAAASAGQPPPTQTVRLAVTGNAYNSIPELVGEKLGIFAQHGISLDKVTLQQGAAELAALAAGSADVADALPPQTVGAAIQHGQSVEFFCGVIPSINQQLVVSPDESVPSTAQGASWTSVITALKGKSIGVPALGGGVAQQVQVAAKDAGLSPDSLNLVAVGQGPTATAALTYHKVDALVTYPFLTQELLSSNQAKQVLDFGKDIPAFSGILGAGAVATRSWLSSHAATAKAYCAAFGASLTAAMDPKNQQVVDGILQSTFALSGAGLLTLARQTLTALSTDLPPANVEKAYQMAQQMGTLAASPTLSYGTTVFPLPK